MLEKLKNYLFITVTDGNSDGTTVGKRKINLSHCSLYVAAVYLLGFLFYCMARVAFESNHENAFFVVFIILCAALSVAFFAMLFVLLKRTKNEKYNRYNAAVLLGISNYCICETLNNSSLIKAFFLFTIISVFLYVFAFMLGAVLFKNPKIWFIFIQVCCTIFALCQYYVVMFRGTPIRLIDFKLLRSAYAVEGEYSFTISFSVILAVALTVLNIAFIVFMHYSATRLRSRFITAGALAACILTLVFTKGIVYTDDNIQMIWLPDTLSERLGSLDVVFYDIMFNQASKPDDYSEEKVEQKLNGYTVEKKNVGTPIVIGILNESLADHKHVGDYKANLEPLSVWKSLKNNTIKGYTTVSPYGGATCNSEYEVLTGNSLMFLPRSAMPFTTYCNDHMNSIVDIFNKYNFETIGMSPVTRDLYDYENVYKRLGFDHVYLLDSKEKIFKNIPRFDSQLYKYIIDLVDSRDKNKGLFLWTDTMQNHSPYDKSNLRSYKLKLEEPYNEEAEIYLNSVRLSDEATLNLINHFNNYDEKVVIFMFGDHFPNLAKFDAELLKQKEDLDEFEKTALTHQTPFFVWSNKPLEQKEINEMSLNYLSNEVFKAAGIPLEPYQQETENIRKSIPIITSWGYKLSNGVWHSRDVIDEKYKDVLNDYSTLSYYRLFDSN